MTEKIHCDLLEMYGIDWKSLSPETIDLIAEKINTIDELLGTEPDLYGFVGTRRIENYVGGYFAIQYSDEEYHYDKHKNLSKILNHPFERIFFIFFIKTGKVLLQNSKFAGITLTMDHAISLFKDAINYIFTKCNLPAIISLELAPEEATHEKFIKEFEASERVEEIEITYPDGKNIPVEFIYYNPQKDRNAIIRESHTHDYPELKKIDLEASENGNLKKVHLRDLIYAGQPQYMKYSNEKGHYKLRRSARRKFEFHIDMETDQVTEQQLQVVVEILHEERAVDIDKPTPNRKHRSPSQLDMFGKGNGNDEE